MENLTELYMELRDPVFRYLYYLTGDSDLAEDLTQETFMQALISLARFRGDSSVKTWLFSIARNTYLKNQKKSSRLLTVNLNDNRPLTQSALPPAGGYAENPLTKIIRTEESANISRLIGQLPENYRTVLILREYEGWEYRELAQFLAKTENWVRVNYYRAKQLLKELYQAKEGGSQKCQ
ncbi:MAG TPA: RNA polymerase sigma factor [Peptococcaceae bacterium]|nr:RNA polymerase sigma factor [Peptococcaceae bacterium]